MAGLLEATGATFPSSVHHSHSHSAEQTLGAMPEAEEPTCFLSSRSSQARQLLRQRSGGEGE